MFRRLNQRLVMRFGHRTFSQSSPPPTPQFVVEHKQQFWDALGMGLGVGGSAYMTSALGDDGCLMVAPISWGAIFGYVVGGPGMLVATPTFFIGRAIGKREYEAK